MPKKQTVREKIGRRTPKSSSKGSSKPVPAISKEAQEAGEEKRRFIHELDVDQVKPNRHYTELRETKEQLRTTLESIGDGFFACDSDWRFVYVNPAAEHLLGMHSEELLGKIAWEVFPLTIGTRLESEYRRAAAGDVREFENFYKPWDRWFYIRCFPREGGGMTAYFQDITQRKHTETALRESEERYRSLVESTNDSIYLVDEDCNYLFMNRNHRERHGVSSTQVKGMAYDNFHTQQATDAFRESVKMVFETVSQLSYEYQSDRDEKFFIRTLSPIMDGERVKAVSVISKDITSQKQAQNEGHLNRLKLAHLERLATMGELTASMAHELNQPLTAILSNAQTALRLIKRNTPEMDEVQAILQDIISDNRRASAFIKHLRTIFKKDDLAKKSLNINRLIEDVINLFKSEAILREISIETALDRKLPSALGNEIHLQQTILNLILNASESLIEVSDSPKRIIISTMRENESYLKIGVRDFGKGIDPEDHAIIFKPYFTTKREGMGMGLSICRSIVEVHGGKIWAENNPDQGASFYFTLPTTDEGK